MLFILRSRFYMMFKFSSSLTKFFTKIRKITQLLLISSVLSLPVFQAKAQTQTTSSANVQINWDQNLRPPKTDYFGLNVNMGLYNSISSNPAYQQRMRNMKPSYLRLHPISTGLDTDYRNWSIGSTWQLDRINGTLDGLKKLETPSYKPNLVVNIGGWRNGFKTTTLKDPNNPNPDTNIVTSGLLDPSEYVRFEEFCAQLVKILNKDQGRGIKYFEILNERDLVYDWNIQQYNKKNYPNGDKTIPSQMAEMANIYNRVVKAMKAVDPNIQVGGPSFAFPFSTESVKTFINQTANQQNPTTLDFLSAHGYASGSLKDPNEHIFGTTAWNGQTMKQLRESLDLASPARRIPLWWDEYNISWDYTVNDQRMRNGVGAVYDALMAYHGYGQADVVMSWNDADYSYGKLDAKNNYHPRPAGKLADWIQTDWLGQAVVSTSSLEELKVIAFKSKNKYSVNLINPSNKSIDIKWSMFGQKCLNLQPVKKRQIVPNGVSEGSMTYLNAANSFSVGPYSYTQLTFTDSGLICVT
jgi:Glycosyl hydrolases family 39